MSSILLDINQHSRKIVEEASINDTDISRSALNSVDDLMEFETGLSLSNGKDDWENIQCSGGHNTTTRELVSRIERNAPVPEPLTCEEHLYSNDLGSRPRIPRELRASI